MYLTGKLCKKCGGQIRREVNLDGTDFVCIRCGDRWVQGLSPSISRFTQHIMRELPRPPRERFCPKCRHQLTDKGTCTHCQKVARAA